ncbi:MAG: hypothetical protein ABEH56_00430 [Salinirussus sp.]
MNWRRGLLYAGLAVGALVAIRIAGTVAFAVVRALRAGAAALVVLCVTGLLVYGGYRLFSWARRSELASGPDADGSRETTSTEPADRVDRIKRQYVDGELSENEFERRLERAFESPETDSFEREPE